MLIEEMLFNSSKDTFLLGIMIAEYVFTLSQDMAQKWQITSGHITLLALLFGINNEPLKCLRHIGSTYLLGKFICSTPTAKNYMENLV